MIKLKLKQKCLSNWEEDSLLLGVQKKGRGEKRSSGEWEESGKRETGSLCSYSFKLSLQSQLFKQDLNMPKPPMLQMDMSYNDEEES